MARIEQHAWRVTVVAMVLTLSPIGPTPSALAAFVDPATAGATLSTAVLASPSDLAAGTCLLGGVALTWTATPSAWADGYEVWWGTTDGGSYTRSATTTGTSITVTDVYRSVLGTTNYFRVRAYKGANWKSAFSNQASALCLL